MTSKRQRAIAKRFVLPPIIVTETDIDDETARFTAKIEALGIEEFGASPESVVCYLIGTVATLWHEFVCHPSEELAPDGVELRRKLLALLSAEPKP
jgi:hypothetical protein